MIDLISATRTTQELFREKSPLGFSLGRLAHDKRITPYIACENSIGLSEIFNDAIQAESPNDILVFVHDDVFLDDFFLVDHVVAGLETFDVIGLAGNRTCVEGHIGWSFINDDFEWAAQEYLSGSVAYANHPFGGINYFGPSGVECQLLDGVFMAARRSTLIKHSVLFDPQFCFHFYDLDFCRTAAKQGLSLGTWPIALTHSGKGSYDSQAWRDSLALYRKKWGT